MQFINKVVDHLYAMGGLEGNATDYPVMLCVYLGIFVICAIASVTLCLSRHGERIIWVPDQHKVIKSKFSYMAMLLVHLQAYIWWDLFLQNCRIHMGHGMLTCFTPWADLVNADSWYI